jgi:hypothetical protein
MGRMVYENAPVIRIDDWTLAHLQTVIVTKLRRDESFTFSWEAGTVEGEETSGAGTVWISRASALYFAFDGERPQALNKRWLVSLANAANGSGGLRVTDEPA